MPHIRTNAAVAGAILEDAARPDGSGLTLLREAAECGSRRAAIIACCASPARWPISMADKVGRVHLAEALSYRALADEVRRAA